MQKDKMQAAPAPLAANRATASKTKLIAFYLTQFHPFPENDTWWGKGFTEWTNATKAIPYFRGHYQPHLPADLGFYDLRVRETRHDQIRLAKSYGIDGFCYYYYWFSGKRLLERPLDDMLADPESDMPFCLCWANENWTRRWDAAEHEILIAQKYQPNDDVDFIRGLIPFFEDPRYIRIDGAPLLIVYRPQHLPDAKNSARIWREECARAGIPKLQVRCALTHGNWDYKQYDFDGGIEFPPHNMRMANRRFDVEIRNGFRGYIPQYNEVAHMYLSRTYGHGTDCYRGVFPSWDNTARRNVNGTIILNGTPENYEYWLAEAIRRTERDFPTEERLVFVNAWNEWAEGCHLEPDRKYGHKFLEATYRAKSGLSILRGWTHKGIPSEARISPMRAPYQYGVSKMNWLTSKLRQRLSKSKKKEQAKTVEALVAERVDPVRRSRAALRRLYVETMIATLDGTLYEDPPLRASTNKTPQFEPAVRNLGLDWPSKAYTMIGTRRLKNVRYAVDQVIRNNIPGDFVETGVWRGGACILARAVMKAYDVTDRLVVACDSFEGLPPPDPDKYPADAGLDFHTYADLAVSLSDVQENFRKMGLLDDQVKFIKGFFKDTMHLVPSKHIAVLRLDGDMYESTIQVLEALFDRVSDGGFVIVDDYCVVPACKAAVDDFLKSRNLRVDIRNIDSVGVFFRKGETPK